MKFGVITPNLVAKSWPVVGPLLEKAQWSGESNYGMEHIKYYLEKGDFQLWAWVEDQKIIACAVTQIQVFPLRKVCSVMMVGGSGLHIWKKEAVDMVADWGRKNGCNDIEGYVRKGWLRVLKDWRVAWITIRRSL